MTGSYLTEREASELEALEEERGHGDSVKWDEPKTVRGVVCREVETVEFVDKRDNSTQSKRVLALRTADGIVTIWEGPGMLNARLFDGEQRDDEPLGPPVKGQLVIVEYKGERTSQTTDRSYKSFDVARGPLPEQAEKAAADASVDELADDAAHADEDPEGPGPKPNDDDIPF